MKKLSHYWHNLRTRGLLFLMALSLLLQLVPAPTANAFSVTSGPTFNDPFGTTSAKNGVLSQINNAIANTPKGSVIRIAAYVIKNVDSADLLIAAHKRGVIVQLVTDNHLYHQDDDDKEAADTVQLERLKVALGTSVVYDNSKSFIKICDFGCMSDYQYASLHAKLYMFSTTGDSKLVTMISSSNLSGGASIAWNNIHKIVGNSVAYEAMKTYFYKMARNENDTDQYMNLRVDKTYRLYTFPRQTSDLSDDNYYTMLQKVKCTGAATGYGTSGKTAINLAMYKWTDGRLDVAKELRKRANEGCVVRFLTAKHVTNPEVFDILLAPSSTGKASTVKIRNADKTSSGSLVNYMHHKFIAINGYYSDVEETEYTNARAKIVFTGSHNLTTPALRYNNEVMLRVRSDSQHDKYISNFNKIWSSYSTSVSYVNPN